MCVECTAHYKNNYPQVCMSVDQLGMKEEILPMHVTTVAMKVIVHHNIFQHFTVPNRTVYREATMQISQRKKWVNQQNNPQNINECLPLKKTRRNCVAEKWWICIDSFEE